MLCVDMLLTSGIPLFLLDLSIALLTTVGMLARDFQSRTNTRLTNFLEDVRRTTP